MSARTGVRVGRRAGAELSHRAEPGRRPSRRPGRSLLLLTERAAGGRGSDGLSV